ncbi:hypothetical protein HCC13_07030 [Streptococcus suis]|nr:hypothetical protein [Streptococcus suis]
MLKKSLKLLKVAIITLSMFPIGTVFANEQPYIEVVNPEIQPNQKVLAIPEGGFIYKLDGSSDFSDETIQQNGGVILEYQTYLGMEDLQDGSISAEEFLESVGAGTRLRAADPYSKPLKVLADREAYKSNEFSGSGWRFSGLRFKPASGTGIYLAWRVEGDSGMVGTYQQAVATYKGSLAGTSVYPGQRPYIASDYQGLYFYTYNPVPGSVYIVENW